MTKLSDLVAAGIGKAWYGEDVVVSGVQHDSRRVKAGDLFVAIVGGNFDGTKFVDSAIEAGALAVLASKKVSGCSGILSEDLRRDMAKAAHLVFGDPTLNMNVLGVTGTNGKTTTTTIFNHLARANGAKSVLSGTMGIFFDDEKEDLGLTTPESTSLASFLNATQARGANSLTMEVSSHALSSHRVDGIHFDIAAFTNFSQDHLDFHGSMEAYAAAKARFFHEFDYRHALLNLDDDFGRKLSEDLGDKALSYSASNSHDADYRAKNVIASDRGLSFKLVSARDEIDIEAPLFGAYNVDNLLLVFAALDLFGFDLQECANSLRNFSGVPGRLQRVWDKPQVFVDYAHTPDALRSSISALRGDAKLWVVFGCGGDRDKRKRGPMGIEAARADYVIATSDNPRHEEPRSIISDIEHGLESAGRMPSETFSTDSYRVEVDRRQAIELVLSAADPGDRVLIAGKGHETYQIIGDIKIDFDDAKVVRDFFAGEEK